LKEIQVKMNTEKKVLHIEDDFENRRLVQHIIESKNLKYHFAVNGLMGLKLAEEIIPDLVLVDISLPDLQGYEITTYLKNLPELTHTNIVAVTGHSDSETRSMTKAAGCDDFIAKPFDITHFSDQLDRWLSPEKLTPSEPPSLHLLQKYNTKLVSKLISKITDLEDLNQNLRNLNKNISTSKKELEIYNDRLLYLNKLTNFFHEHKDPAELLRLLPTKIIESFPVARCIFYGVWNKELLKPLSYALLKEDYPDPDEVAINYELNKLLSTNNNLLFVENASECRDVSLQELAKNIGSNSFVLSQLSGKKEEIMAEISHADDNIARKFKSNIPDNIIIFIEPKSAQYLFPLNEKRILVSFLQTMKNIFENSILFNDLIQLYKEREEEAIRDGLTKLYNFRYFMNALEREISRGKRFNGTFSLLMIDIDYFKQYNDRLGHLKGDRILSTLTSLLELNTRKIDIVARYGGEEFTIILPGIEKDNAFLIANKLRELIDYYNFPDQEGQPSGNLTISTGLASFPEDAQDAKELIDNADKALYKAKELGRNQVCVYGRDVISDEE
jgi:diguanylate cyclase (GGDEF)-like protein